MNARVTTARGLAKATGAFSRVTRQGGGTTMPGHVFLRLAPAGLSKLAAELTDGIVAVSATNGKTTTSAMLSAIIGRDQVVCRNGAGANLMTGIATTLVTRPGNATIGVLEVDEAALPAVTKQLAPSVLLLGNLFRDQLDRHGELEMVADRWRELVATLAPSTTLVLGADDPVIDGLAGTRANVVRFGIDDPGVSLGVQDAAADSTFCVRCGTAYVYDEMYLGHLGSYRCPQGDHQRGKLDIAARHVHSDGIRGTTFRVDAPDGSTEVSLPLPGLYNVENALGAIAAAFALGIPTEVAAGRLAQFSAAFGRFERIEVGDREAVLLLFKNPTGANEALRAINNDVANTQVVLALNDRIADGRDISWIWDIDLEEALTAAAHITCTGTRAAELAVRLRYAGVPAEQMTTVAAPEAAFDGAIATTAPDGRIFVLASYTAMLDLHGVLADRGLTQPFWQEQA